MEDQSTPEDKLSGGPATGDVSPVLSLSAQEERLLELYDRSVELELEIALLNAQFRTSHDPTTSDVPDDELESQIAATQQEVLEVKAQNSLQNQIVQSVLVTDPIVKAVNLGENATAAEQRLLPLIQARDALSISHTNLSSKLASRRSSLASKEVENIIASNRNRELTKELLALTDSTKPHRKEDIKDAKVRSQIDGLEGDVKMRKARWRMMKSVVAAVIAGSGVDWARDDRLRDLVLEDEDGDFG
ncbi:MAG: hypothetical protein M1837_006597 [Sclerophora amabilis]|nr:MAG: hypothetical protein M1837_006597 [Sclerophora amabilis]